MATGTRHIYQITTTTISQWEENAKGAMSDTHSMAVYRELIHNAQAITKYSRVAIIAKWNTAKANSFFVNEAIF